MENNDDIFVKFMLQHKWRPAPLLYFRLYYDDQGCPVKYSRKNEPGTYIDVTPQEFNLASRRVRVRDGKLWHLPSPRPAKLVPGDTGTRCHEQDVTLICKDNNSGKFWRLKVYDQN